MREKTLERCGLPLFVTTLGSVVQLECNLQLAEAERCPNWRAHESFDRKDGVEAAVSESSGYFLPDAKARAYEALLAMLALEPQEGFYTPHRLWVSRVVTAARTLRDAR